MARRGRPKHPDVLTPREWEVLALLRERLGVTVHAARFHVGEILSKLNVATREEAAAWQPPQPRRIDNRTRALQGAVALVAFALIASLAALQRFPDAFTGLGLRINILPPGVPAADVKGVHFLDNNHGWLVANGAESDGGVQLVTYRTTDGGATWRSSDLGVPDINYAISTTAPADIDFIDNTHGWIVVKIAKSVQQNIGDLYRTTNGGATWTKLSIPTGDPVYFVDDNTGWAVGGPTCSQIWATHDGGASWTEIAPIPSDQSGTDQCYSEKTFGLPQPFGDAMQLILPVFTISTSCATYVPTQLLLLLSNDDGGTWVPQASGAIATSFIVGTTIPSPSFRTDPGSRCLPTELS